MLTRGKARRQIIPVVCCSMLCWIGLVMLGQARGQPRPGQPRPSRMEIIKKRREARSEECSLHWGRTGLAILAMWPEPGEIHPSPPPLSSGQSPPWGLPPITTNLQLPSSILNQHRSNLHHHVEPTTEDVSVKQIMPQIKCCVSTSRI